MKSRRSATSTSYVNWFGTRKLIEAIRDGSRRSEVETNILGYLR